MTRRFFNGSTSLRQGYDAGGTEEKKTRPTTIWIGPECAKGYERGDFDAACRRYLPGWPSNSCTTSGKKHEKFW